MMQRLVDSERSGRWLGLMALLGLVLFATSLAVLMIPYSTIIEHSGGKDLTCLQVPFTQARAAAIIDSYDAGARAAAKALHFPGDTLFPIGYALLYTGLLGLVVRDLRGRWRDIGLIVMFFPAAAMLLDWTENIFIVRMITLAEAQSTAAIPGWMPLLGGLAGSIKYLLLSVLTPLFGMAAILFAVVTDRQNLKAGTLLIDFLVFSMLGFNLFQVVTSVGPCLGPTA